MKKFLIPLLLLLSIPVFAAEGKSKLMLLEPSNWWIGMNNPSVQLMCYGENISETVAEIDYDGVSITKQVETGNPNYLFVYLNIDKNTKPGKFKINFKRDGKKVASREFELKARKEGSAMRESFGPQDAVYLLMPDRFANGNNKNDKVKGYIETVDRSDLGARHGGDLQGIIDKVPYIEDLGCTALWITPFFDDNDQPYSYHHYSAGNYYKVDPRLGTNEDYMRLADSCRAHGIKLIIDIVPNHCGGVHWWMKDTPADDWLHTWPEYTGSNYRMTAWTDPHASKIDLEILQKGWFSNSQPDLNLSNPLLFDYLSQAYLWWIESAGVSGIRVDTYPYNDIKVASKFVKVFRDEYPNMNIVGECWVKTPLEIAYYQSGNNNKDGFESNLPSVMDFVLKDVLHAAFNEKDGWDTGMSRFYAHYAQDFAYADVNNVMNFLDNHDIDRFSVSVKRDVDKYKMGIAMLLTTRGYPQIYAGDEIMLDGIPGNYEGYRFDFPGGWKEDKRNAFTAEGRTAEENEVFDYMRTLLQYRKNNTALQTGKMVQFIPYDGIYVFSRQDAENTVLVVFNNNEEAASVPLQRYEEIIQGRTSGKEVASGQSIDLSKPLEMPAKTAWIIELGD